MARAATVQKIKREVEAGTYVIEPGVIAEAMIRRGERNLDGFATSMNYENPAKTKRDQVARMAWARRAKRGRRQSRLVTR